MTRDALQHRLRAAVKVPPPVLRTAKTEIALSDWVACHVSLAGQWRGKSVLLNTTDQLSSLLALIVLDGMAGRIVLCPPGLSAEHLAYAATTASVDAWITDETARQFYRASAPTSALGELGAETEWVLLTSGTTGQPKLVVHTLASLAGPIGVSTQEEDRVWSTFYDIRRYGGLQIALRALLGGHSLVLAEADETTEAFLERAAGSGLSHISGTPTHWRRALISPSSGRISPRYIRLSGEVADQAVLDRLVTFYPSARVVHAFASTEAGLAFEVHDRLAGFPASLLGRQPNGVEMKVEDESLRIRSNRVALCYLGLTDRVLADSEGFVDTGDVIKRRGDRCYFAGRKDGVINVGGLKFHPEEVEAAINRHPKVEMSVVVPRKNPITGSVSIAEVVLRADYLNNHNDTVTPETLKREILDVCRSSLAPYKVPAVIRIVPALKIGASGKLDRSRG